MATETQQPTQALAIKTETSPLILELAKDWRMTAVSMINTLKATVFPQKDRSNNAVIVTDAQMLMFLQVCGEYKLNPFIKEIYAFPTKGGGIVPMVPVDGWANIVNRHPQMNGVEFKDDWYVEEGKPAHQKSLFSTTCIIYRKDRAHPIAITEYMQECFDGTKDPWKKWPARMLRHKAFIQCARIAFSLAGIYDPDEAERIAEGGTPDKGIQRPSRSSETIEGTAKVSEAPQSTVTTIPKGETMKNTVSPAKTATQPVPDPSGCKCSCCKALNCDCLSKDEVDQCGCPNCVTFMKLSRENPESNTRTEEPAAEEEQATEEASPSAEDVGFNQDPVGTGEPDGPYVPHTSLGKMWAIAKSNFGPEYEAKVHEVLKAKWGILSTKKIPKTLWDEALKAVGGDKFMVPKGNK